MVDPYADAEEIKTHYQLELKNSPEGGVLSLSKEKYDAIIVAVAHREYREMTESDFVKLAKNKCLLVDVKGLYRNEIKELQYWSL